MMRREDYKAVKHMDKTQMEKYLQTVYQRVHFRADFCKTVTVTGNHGGIRMERLTQTHRHSVFELCTSDFYDVIKRCSFVI